MLPFEIMPVLPSMFTTRKRLRLETTAAGSRRRHLACAGNTMSTLSFVRETARRVTN